MTQNIALAVKKVIIEFDKNTDMNDPLIGLFLGGRLGGFAIQQKTGHTVTLHYPEAYHLACPGCNGGHFTDYIFDVTKCPHCKQIFESTEFTTT